MNENEPFFSRLGSMSEKELMLWSTEQFITVNPPIFSMNFVWQPNFGYISDGHVFDKFVLVLKSLQKN